MRVTTFLKNRHKKWLLRKIDKLEQSSVHSFELSYSFLRCSRIVPYDFNPYQSYFYPSFWNAAYSCGLYCQFYNDYLHFLCMHNRAESKIKNLRKKLKQL